MDGRGPRMGWTLGGLGGLIWMVVLAVVLFAQGNYVGGAAGLGFFCAGVFYLIRFAPWKYEHTPLRRIYLGLAAIILAAAAVLLLLWLPEGIASVANIPSLAILFSLFIPAFVFGNKSWSELHKKPPQNLED